MEKLLRWIGLRRSGKALAASARIPVNSDLDSVVNGQNASASVAQLSLALADALDQEDVGENVRPDYKNLLNLLDSKAAQYANSQIDYESRAYTDFECSQAQAQLISIACKCAMGAYEPKKDIAITESLSFQRDHTVAPSLAGSIKTMTSTVVSSTQAPESDGEFLPVLVIAVRGTVGIVDWMVNASAQPKDADQFLGSSARDAAAILAHTGFLNGARALSSSASKRIQAFLSGPGRQPDGLGRKPHVLFTGHSAGGAVASLLFRHFLSKQEYASSMRFSCITFGSPPCVSAALDMSEYERAGALAVCLNIINEYDVVSRADLDYVLLLASLLGSPSRPPPPPALDLEPRGSDMGHTPPLSTAGPASNSGRGQPDNGKEILPLPKAVYKHIGPRILLWKPGKTQANLLRAVVAPVAEFEGLLFCRTAIHKGRHYSSRVQQLEERRFNGHDGWETPRF